MLELHNRNRQTRMAELKEAGEIDFTDIPGYSGMQEHDRLRYEDLYLLACYPELLQQLPEDVRDLHALVYFIFSYNLSNRWINGELIHITPFIPVKWTHESGLRMEMKSGLYASLLEEAARLQSSVGLYFSVLMLSLELIREAFPEAKSYRIMFTLLNVVLDGRYCPAVFAGLKELKSDLNEPWLLDYLPNSTQVVVDKNSSNVREIRGFLLGSETQRGIFSPPRIPQEPQMPISVPK